MSKCLYSPLQQDVKTRENCQGTDGRVITIELALGFSLQVALEINIQYMDGLTHVKK